MSDPAKATLTILPPVLTEDQTTKISMEPLALSIPHAAALLDMGASMMWKLLSTGELTGVRINGSRRITVDELREFLARRRAEAIALAERAAS